MVVKRIFEMGVFTVILSLSLGFKLSLKFGFSWVFGSFSEQLLIFEQIYVKCIENICIFIKLKTKMYKNCPIHH